MKKATKQSKLDGLRTALERLRDNHPDGLFALGSGNAHHVLTRLGVDGETAELAEICTEISEESGGMGVHDAINNLVDMVDIGLHSNGDPIDKFAYDCSGVEPGARDNRGLFTHPDPMFTPENFNGRRYGITADMAAHGNIAVFQDWRDKDEIQENGYNVLSAWDAENGRVLTAAELAELNRKI